jgi:hypothetical protein
MMLTSKVLHARSDDELKEVIERWCTNDPAHGWQVHSGSYPHERSRSRGGCRATCQPRRRPERSTPRP